MSVVTEIFDSLPYSKPELVLKRDEDLLFNLPPHPVPNEKWVVNEPLPVYYFMTHYEPMPFARPRGVFEGKHLRFEWQNLNGRQPFYHRNTDVEELSFQLAGERTLITDRGWVELRPGDFTPIPVGIAHDNYSRNGVHLIFYFYGPLQLMTESTQTGNAVMPPFEGWEPKNRLEAITACLGGPHCDVGVSRVDETLVLQGVETSEERLQVTRPKGKNAETVWVYQAPKVWLGTTTLDQDAPRIYRRHRCADEIQYQVRGERTLITQRGTTTLKPGECVSIPLGCAFTSVASEETQYLSILTTEPAPAASEPVRYAEMKGH